MTRNKIYEQLTLPLHFDIINGNPTTERETHGR